MAWAKGVRGADVRNNSIPDILEHRVDRICYWIWEVRKRNQRRFQTVLPEQRDGWIYHYGARRCQRRVRVEVRDSTGAVLNASSR